MLLLKIGWVCAEIYNQNGENILVHTENQFNVFGIFKHTDAQDILQLLTYSG